MQLPTLFSQVKNPEPTLLPVLDSAISALQATGGKIICSLSTLPTWGPGRLFLRDKNDMHGIETERKLFQTEHPGWKKTAGKMVESGVGIDFYIAAPGGKYMDVATIGKSGCYALHTNMNLTAGYRSCFCGHWGRNLLLPQLHRPSRFSKALARDQTYTYPGNWLPSIDESTVF